MRFPIIAVRVKREDEEESPHSQTEDSSSIQLIKTESDESNCGEPEPASNLDPNHHKQLDTAEEAPGVCEIEDSFDGGDKEESFSVSGPSNEDTGQQGCSVCGERFTEQGALKRHTRVHTGERPFGCTVCGERFAEQGILKRHIRVHTGEKPFSCDVCGKGFRQQNTLKRHTNVHTGEKPYGCDVCGKMFREQTTLKDTLLFTQERNHFAVVFVEKDSLDREI